MLVMYMRYVMVSNDLCFTEYLKDISSLDQHKLIDVNGSKYHNILTVH